MKMKKTKHNKIKILYAFSLALFLISSFSTPPKISKEAEEFQPQNGTSYYVSNTGNDANNGTSTLTPWENISKVNTEMSGVINQGDDIYFNRGDDFRSQATELQLRLGGNSSNPMIIGAYGTGDKPILGGSTEHGIEPQSSLGNLTIEYLNISDCTKRAISAPAAYGPYWNFIIRHVEGHNCSEGIFLQTIYTYKIENCAFSDVGTGYDIYGDGSHISRDGKIWNCTASAISGNGDGIDIHNSGGEANYGGPRHWVKNCTLYNFGEAGIDVTYGDNCPDSSVYIEDCTIYDNLFGIIVGHNSVNITIDNCHLYDNDEGVTLINGAKNIIVRNTVIQNFTNGEQGFNSYGGSTAIDNTNNITFYNNDIISNGTGWVMRFNQPGVNNQENLTFKNNIIYSVMTSSPNAFLYVVDPSEDITLDNITNINWSYNLWWRGDGLTGNHWNVDGTAYNFTNWVTNHSQISDELRQDPLIRDANASDFSLLSNSPCIDAGGWLTTTYGGGTDKQWVTVHNSNYFMDGYGIDGLSGDNIFVGSNTDLQIIDINYYNDSLRVNRSINWVNGENVSLSNYNNSIIDVGAREYETSEDSEIQFISINGNGNGTVIFDSTPTFNWTLISNTARYNLQISNTSDFSYLEVNLSNVSDAIFPSEYWQNSTTVSFTLPTAYALTESKTYYIRVKAYMNG